MIARPKSSPLLACFCLTTAVAAVLASSENAIAHVSFQVLPAFAGGADDGIVSYAALLQATDGNVYRTTADRAQATERTANVGLQPGRLTGRPSPRTLSLEDRVAYQAAIEDVYWRHRMWPTENPQPKPALEQVMPLSTIRAKVEDYLRKSQALEVYWHRPITGAQLQAEMDRMARETKQPDVLTRISDLAVVPYSPEHALWPDFAVSDFRSPATEGDTLWVKKKTSHFSSCSTGF